ncbi:putative mitochondrial transporter UCP3 [Zonotrichia albicollis]|uniref:putative mitochondrial transporter UCP3 n=1 Tax=Zonotrichia albicollis TaxID=44394 RepID=UPI003D80BC9D
MPLGEEVVSTAQGGNTAGRHPCPCSVQARPCPPSHNVPCRFVAAFGAGFCATEVASPVDVVKTRCMNGSPGQYRNALSCLLALLMQDGPAGLYKGFVPSLLRLGSWNVVMFVSYERLQRLMVLARPALA